MLQRLSEERGARMDSSASKADIPRFLKVYGDQVAMDDIADPIDSFENFNQFFYRRLKAGARPIAHSDDDCVLVSAADCRFIAFNSVDESCKFWIKVRKSNLRHWKAYCVHTAVHALHVYQCAEHHLSNWI